MLLVTQVLLNILRCYACCHECMCTVDQQVFIYMSVNECLSPFFVSHPKQSEVTAHSGALEATEPALTHKHTQIHACTQSNKKHREAFTINISQSRKVFIILKKAIT